MSDSIKKLYEGNSINGGMWVSVMKALGYSEHTSTEDFRQSFNNLNAGEIIDKVNNLLDWCFENDKDENGRQLAAELILQYINVEVVLQLIHSGNTIVEDILIKYLNQYQNKDRYLLMVEALLIGKWDRVPGDNGILEATEA